MHAGRSSEQYLLEGLVGDPPPWALFHAGLWGLGWLERLHDVIMPPQLRVAQITLQFMRPQARDVLIGG